MPFLQPIVMHSKKKKKGEEEKSPLNKDETWKLRMGF